ncbi:YheU family protein [Endozoicomonas sp. YOMI1]|uniref:YheU family protein n=1 Tax=Endozoicomonas sp. YOMI1 TaxID=2828739 RepID=UPI002147B5F4|nr:YheU family protein [Endozoicomonas sp. YOMI1]
MIIPYEMIEREALNRLIEEFVSREGTDNGYEEALSTRVAQVLFRLKSGDMVIVFDQESQTPNILHKDVATQILSEQDV